MKAFYPLVLAMVLSACGGQEPVAAKTEGKEFYFADKYEFANEQQAVYFERAARFRVLQQGINGDFERFLKGEMPSQEQIAKYRENITQALGYYAGETATDDPFQSCGKAVQDAETLVKIMVTSGGSGITDLDKQSAKDYHASMQQCRKDLSSAEIHLKKK